MSSRKSLLNLPRVYPIVDTTALIRVGMAPLDFARALCDAGVRFLQFRHKGQFTREMFETLERVIDLGADVIVDDRMDLAAATRAVGVHLGQDDLPPEAARRLAPAKLIGFSTHSREQLGAAEAEPVDYLAIGPVFSTGSKANPDPVVGPDALPALRALTQKPLVAIGGITRATAPQAWAAGIDSVAVIGDLIPADPTPQTVSSRMEEWLNLSLKQ